LNVDDGKPSLIIDAEISITHRMDEEEEVMGSYLILVNQSLMAFMEMDQPSEASRIGGDDVKFL
jgi:hypothetical protein